MVSVESGCVVGGDSEVAFALDISPFPPPPNSHPDNIPILGNEIIKAIEVCIVSFLKLPIPIIPHKP
jgi:hypothetical protein